MTTAFCTATKFAWLTDLHLNFVSFDAWDSLIAEIHEANVESLLITGDISEAEDFAFQLRRLRHETKLPVLFVLGNHDFYRGSIEHVRRIAASFSRDDDGVQYLTGQMPVVTRSGWAICGEDGWGDGRCGEYFQSQVRINDFALIEDLIDLAPVPAHRFIRRQGAASAARLCRQLSDAAEQTGNILVLTHVPPFREACWHDGRHTDDHWAPFFVCQSVGWLLRRFCAAHPACNLLVLCGHTHGVGRSRIAPNLTVWTGSAEYGQPQIAATLDLQSLREDVMSEPVDWSYS